MIALLIPNQDMLRYVAGELGLKRFKWADGLGAVAGSKVLMDSLPLYLHIDKSKARVYWSGSASDSALAETIHEALDGITL